MATIAPQDYRDDASIVWSAAAAAGDQAGATTFLDGKGLVLIRNTSGVNRTMQVLGGASTQDKFLARAAAGTGLGVSLAYSVPTLQQAEKDASFMCHMRGGQIDVVVEDGAIGGCAPHGYLQARTFGLIIEWDYSSDVGVEVAVLRTKGPAVWWFDPAYKLRLTALAKG